MSSVAKERILQKISRRSFLSPLAIAPLWRLAATGAMIAMPPEDPKIQEFDFSSLTLLTPNDKFFVRNHFTTPQLSLPGWKLRVAGHVPSPFEIGYAEISRQRRRTLTVTLECAGNGAGSGGVSTASWEGVPLATFLRRASLSAAVNHIRLIGADRGVASASDSAVTFTRSIPVEKALHPDTLLAFQMNGLPLPSEHGYPLRAIVPGWYGMDSVKWLVGIEAVDHADTSYFMTQRYRAVRLQTIGSEQRTLTQMRVKSIIVRPRQGGTLPQGSNSIRGVAWAGENKVVRVEVSINEGKDWSRATLEGDSQPYSWVLWNYLWEAPAPGTYTLTARAIDNQGSSQPSTPDSRRIDSYELNSYHSIQCEVR